MKTLTVSKVLLVRADDKLLIVQRSADDTLRPLEWDVPGGHSDDGESTAEAGVREAWEETGVVLDAWSLTVVYAMTEIASEGLSVTWVFHIVSTDTPQITLSPEHIAYKWVSVDEALNHIHYERQHRALAYLKQTDLLR